MPEKITPDIIGREYSTPRQVEKKVQVEGYRMSSLSVVFDEDLREDGEYLRLRTLKLSGENAEILDKIGHAEMNKKEGADVREQFQQWARKMGLVCKAESYSGNQEASEGGFIITVDVPEEKSDQVKQKLQLTTTETETRPDGKQWTTEYFSKNSIDFTG